MKSPPHLSHVGTGGAVSAKFCNFTKCSIQQTCPPHAAIGQMCRGEKVARFELHIQAPFRHVSNNYHHFLLVQPSVTLMPSGKDCPKVCAVIQVVRFITTAPSRMAIEKMYKHFCLQTYCHWTSLPSGSFQTYLRVLE